MRVKFAVVLLLGAFVFALGACGVPAVVYRDRDVGLTSGEVGKLESLVLQSSGYWDFGRLVQLQVIEGAPGPYSDSYPSGVVVWRTVFGVEYGRTEVPPIGRTHTELHGGPLMRAWLMFLVPELGMIGLASVLFLLHWRDGRPARKRRIALAQSRVESLALSGLPEINGGDLARALGSSPDKKEDTDRDRARPGRD